MYSEIKEIFFNAAVQKQISVTVSNTILIAFRLAFKNENISEFLIDIGPRKYKINFQGGIYALQTCVSFNKERVMRRELILKNEYVKYINKLKSENNSEETCPICLDKFSESFTFSSFLTNHS